LAQAREALIGYAVRFRDDQLKQGTAGLVYGYLPIPVIASPGPAVAGHSVTEYGAKSHPALESAERHA
jgi:hypothetical protein